MKEEGNKCKEYHDGGKRKRKKRRQERKDRGGRKKIEDWTKD